MQIYNKGSFVLRFLLGAGILATAACDHSAHDSCDPNNPNACGSGQFCGTCSTSTDTCNVCGTSGQDCHC